MEQLEKQLSTDDDDLNEEDEEGDSVTIPFDTE
jgi:hypothetical protein